MAIKIFGVRNFDQYDDKTQIENDMMGGNIGNSLFKMAVYRSIDWSKCVSVNNVQDADVVCYILANIFGKYFKNNLLTKASEVLNNKKRAVVIGGGIQKVNELSDPSIQNAARQFSEAVISTGGEIGVRGKMTYNFITSLVEDQSKVCNLGCPSLRYWGGSPTLLREKTEFNYDSKIGVLFTPYADSEEYTAFCYKVWKSYPHSFAMMQDRREALLIHNGVEIKDAIRIRELYPTYKEHFMIRQKRCRLRCKTSDWINMLKGFDFCVGSRIHGCVASILAGVPALLIAIDERQVEIAKFHKIPYIRQNMINRDTSLEALYYYSYENMDNYYSNYNNSLKVYTDFLTRNGIPVNPEFM